MNNLTALEKTIWNLAMTGGSVMYQNVIIDVDSYNINDILIESEKGNVTPILHSLNKLTEPVLDGGKVPIVELAKKTCPFDTSQNSDFEYEAETFYDFGGVDCWCNILINGRVVWCIEYRAISNSFHQLVEEAPKLSYQQESFDFLKSNHFNIENLPEGTYIEKSTLKRE